jgi:tetratricopeptide (TPR) repeat protein
VGDTIGEHVGEHVGGIEGMNRTQVLISGLILMLAPEIAAPLANAASPTCYAQTIYTKALYAGDWARAAQSAQTTANHFDSMFRHAKPDTFDQSSNAALRTAWELYVAQLTALQGDVAAAENARGDIMKEFEDIVPFKPGGVLTIAVEKNNASTRMLFLVLQGDSAGAIAYYNQLNKDFHGTDGEALYVLALYKHGDLDEAEKVASSMVKNGDPYNDPTALYVLGQIAKMRGHGAGASRYLKDAADAYKCNWSNARTPSSFLEWAAILKAARSTVKTN